MRFFLIGFSTPFLVYIVYVFKYYIRLKFKSHPDFIQNPKYAILVFKVHRLMMAFMPYYVPLSKNSKAEFISRVIYLMSVKHFEGREGEKVTIEKRIIIIGALVQLTFGLRNYILPRFKLIAVYPSIFYSKVINTKVKGLTSSVGTLLLSWYDIFHGVHDPKDNLNLALHEWSHALMLDFKENSLFWIHRVIKRQIRKSESHFERISENKNSQAYLRDYAFTNDQEFFAVSVEHFFETPSEFYRNYPKLFKDLCILLNQNPLNSSKDYKL